MSRGTAEREEPAMTSYAEARAWLASEIARALTITADEVDVNERFRTYGLDSAFATALVARLGQWLGRSLFPTVLWEHPTIDALARHLATPPPRSGTTNDVATTDRALDASVHEAIAVVGIGCRFPGGANSPEAFWKLLRDGKCAVGDVPAERWNIGDYLDADLAAPGKMNTRRGGFIDNVDRFDAQFFGVSPREAAQMDPQQRIVLELAWEALEDAGVPPDSLRGTAAGVFVGAMWSDYARLERSDERRVEQHTATGLDTSIIAARISYSLGLQGPSLTVNTACSSSLVAVHLACQSLRSGESSIALCGGVSLVLAPWSTVAMSKFGAMSPDGCCRAFDAGANGYVRGEGAGLVVLKPLSRALADGDDIYGVILGSAVNNDGFSNGLTAPNPVAQEQVLKKAYANAGIRPSDVDYVEAHGPGTLLGDPIEAHALGAVVGAHRTAENPLRIGSVKTNLGHTEAAAGIAGLIRVLLAMRHGLLPPSLNFDTPNPHIPFESLGLQVQTQPSRWPQPERTPLAGVSSFGFGGTNCHVVLRGAPSPGARAYRIVGDRPAEFRERALALLSFALSPRSNEELDNMSRVLARTRGGGAHRAAFVAGTPEGLVEQILGRLSRANPSCDAPVDRPRIVWVCPGQGSQWLGMGRRLMRAEPVFRAAIEACDRAIQEVAGWSVLRELFATSSSSHLGEVDVVQPVLFSMQVALGSLWRAWGVEPDVIVGHSMGEIAAAHLAGILSLDDAARVVCARSQLVRGAAAGFGGMLSVSLGADDAMHAASQAAAGMVVAAYNSPSATVLSGDGRSIDAAVARFVERGVRASKVHVDYASHSPRMDSVGDALRTELEASPLRPHAARMRMVSTVSLDDLAGPECDASYWASNLRQPVRFMQAIDKILDEGDATFVEISPHPVLAHATAEIGQRRGRALSTFGSGHRELDEHAAILSTLGELYERGAAVSWEHVCRGEPTDRDAQPTGLANAAAGTGEKAAPPGQAHLLTISAKTQDALRVQAKRYADHLAARPDQTLADVCFSATTTRTHFEHRAAILASSAEQARDKLASFAAGSAAAAITGHVARGPEPKLAFLFSGQGAQYASMGRGLYDSEPIFRGWIDACAGRIDADLDRPLRDVMFGATPPGDPARLDETLYAQLSLFSLEYALYMLWCSWGVKPDFVLGHSVGELVASCCAGVMTLDEGLRLVGARARLMQRLPRGGAMAAIAVSNDDAQRELERLGATASIAAVNGTAATVISGAGPEIDRVLADFETRGVEARRLRVSHAFHSPQMDAMLDEFREIASRIDYKPATVPIVSNLTGEIVGDAYEHGEYWVRHVRQAVQFQRGVRTLEERDVRTYVEIGPQPVLLGMLDDCVLDSTNVVRLPSLRHGRPDAEIARRSLGRLWVSGRAIDGRAHGEATSRVTLPTYPFHRARHWLPARSSETQSAGVALRVHVVQSADSEASVAAAIVDLVRTARPDQPVVVRESHDGPPLSRRLRRFIEAAIHRAAEQGRAMTWQPRHLAGVELVRIEPSAPSVVPSVTSRDGAAGRTAPAEGESAAAFVTFLASLPDAHRGAAMAQALRGDAAAILGCAADAVSPDRPLGELGFDSLMSMELRSKIASRVGQKISSTAAFDHPTIDALSLYVLEQVFSAPRAPAVDAATKANRTAPHRAFEGLSVDQALDELSAQLDDVSALLER